MGGHLALAGLVYLPFLGIFCAVVVGLVLSKSGRKDSAEAVVAPVAVMAIGWVFVGAVIGGRLYGRTPMLEGDHRGAARSWKVGITFLPIAVGLALMAAGAWKLIYG